MKRIGLILIVLAVLCGAVGCIQTSTRTYHFKTDPNGTFTADAAVQGSDTQAASIKMTGPDGFTLDVEGMSAKDQVALLSQQQNIKAMELVAALLAKLEALVPGGGAAPVLGTKAPVVKPVRAARKVKVPATQPAVKK
jgi:hypothetical protein